MLFSKLFQRSRKGSLPRRRRSLRPQLEALEDRSLPSTFTVVNLADNTSPGALRWAIGQANTHAGPDLINFAPGLNGTIVLTGSQIDITDDLTIDGPGAAKLTVSGNSASRVFHLSGSATDVEIDGLTISNGRASGTTVTGALGDATLGGGIFNDQAHLTLSQVTVTHNQTAGFIGAGGGIASISGATLTVENCTFSGNLASGTSVDGPGGGIFSDAGSTLTVSQTTFTGNQAIDGGAIAIWGGAVAAVSDSTFSDNLARGNDGGPGQGATPADNGGAIFATDESVVAASAGSTLTVAHSTFTGNHALGGNGGLGSPGSDGGSGGQAQGGAVSVAGVTTLANLSYCTFAN
ncbi:MAG TPA: right-handed parallel beta-helix repeat-containing protein, partial [Gemmataceae bacterium]|nr:right-handed parallel beta-helix repeat-containing protein [Gemmataceae bacterium]